MRHLKKGRKLNRNKAHRLALFRNMLTSLFRHGQIITTVAKAKECCPKADKIISLAKRADKKIAEFTAKLKEAAKGQETPELQKQIEEGAQRIRIAYLRMVFSHIRDKAVVHKIFQEIVPLYKDRKGGYTSVLRYNKSRAGDDSPKAVLRLVENVKSDAKTSDDKKVVKKDKATIKAKQKRRKEREKEKETLKKQKEKDKQEKQK